MRRPGGVNENEIANNKFLFKSSNFVKNINPENAKSILRIINVKISIDL